MTPSSRGGHEAAGQSRLRCTVPDGRSPGDGQPSPADLALATAYAAGASSVRIGALHSLTPKRVLDAVRRAGVPVRSFREASRRYAVVHDRFRVITDEPAAYMIGFFLADACVRLSPAPTLAIALAPRDHEHLCTIRELLGAEHPVLPAPKAVRLTVTSLELVTDLCRWGVIPRKSLRAAPPATGELAPHLWRHYWRGVIDGDGCLSQARGLPVVNLVGSLAVVRAFRAWCRQVAPGSRARPHPVGPGRRAWQFAITGRRARLVIEALYGEATVALPRKAARARQLLGDKPQMG